jgi:hypothetical protein
MNEPPNPDRPESNRDPQQYLLITAGRLLKVAASARKEDRLKSGYGKRRIKNGSDWL